MFPALWEMVQVFGGLWQADFGLLVAIGIILNTVMGAGLWWFVRGSGRGEGALPQRGPRNIR